jgi:opacity protein-like surface antigen
MRKHVLKTLATASLLSCSVLGNPTFAADIPVYKAPPPAPIYTWTGWYFGINTGYSIGADSTTQSATFASPALGANSLINTTGTIAPRGWVLGGQTGYNWQFSHWVVVGAGVETRLWGGWSAKFEYLYVDLGDVTQTLGIPINPAFGAAFTAGAASATQTTHIVDHVVRVGLNWKWGGGSYGPRY